ncbi:hypothetical protein OEA66_04245 [Chryseobacterium sp. KC 927]|uniref:Uncharacterized protein n=2 Tax=Chryseobacterium luquanense TaxID=2983766 RepID=A0ABT3Y099_9FLAO|nr:hypothetical protein [Chryseobacterium luquanense]
MSSEKDSMNVAVDTTSMTNSTPVQNPDTMKMPVDTVNAPVR